MIQACAGPSGIGTEPAGCTLVSACATGEPRAKTPPMITAKQAATAAISPPRAEQPIPAIGPRHASVLNQLVLSPQEISDRLELQQLLIDYSEAIDQRRFDDLDAIFIPDAYIDYRAMGGIDGHYPEIKKWLSEVLPNFAGYAHMLGLPSFRITGDTAAARTFCFNPMVIAGEKPTTMLLGLWYDDEFVRTAAGWRMSRRVETKCFNQSG